MASQVRFVDADRFLSRCVDRAGLPTSGIMASLPTIDPERNSHRVPGPVHSTHRHAGSAKAGGHPQIRSRALFAGMPK
jgi:hypothetical protein